MLYHAIYICIAGLWLSLIQLQNVIADTSGVQELVLGNGMKVLVKEDHRAPVAVSQLWYKVGSSYEHNGITGISHVLEHMMFKGTEKYAAGQFSKIISENGGSDNAFTGSDYTTYFQILDRSKIEISLELEADRMRGLMLSEEEFLKEIEVVKEERRWRTEDNPTNFSYEVAMSNAFQVSPYRQPIIGWMGDLENITVADLNGWYRRWYAPNNATLVIVGDVDTQGIFKLAEQYFGSLPRGDVIPINLLVEPPQYGLKRVTVKRSAELPVLLMFYKVPSITPGTFATDDNWEPYALEVLTGILDGGSSARFSRELIRGKQVSSDIGLGYRLYSRLDNILSIQAIPAQGIRRFQLEKAIREQIKDLQTALVSDAELARVKAQVVSSEIYQKDSVFYQAFELGLLETIGLSWRFHEEYVKRIQSITAQQVQDVARKYLVDNRLTVTELIPLPLNSSSKQSLPSSRSQYVH